MGGLPTEAPIVVYRKYETLAYVTIPKNLRQIQSKVLFELTKRQVVCFRATALVGVPLFFLAKASLTSIRT